MHPFVVGAAESVRRTLNSLVLLLMLAIAGGIGFVGALAIDLSR